VDAAALAFDRSGSGPPLVLIHALGADRHVWRPVTEMLARERDVIAVDLPGFGDSPLLEPGDEPTAAELARIVSEFVRELGVDRPHVAGNSLGGWVALEMALAGDAKSVSAIAPAGLWPRPLGGKPGVGRSIAQAVGPALPLLLASDGARSLALSATVAHPERVPRDEAVRLVRAYADAPGYDAANAAMRAGRFASLERIRVPVTLAWPDRDRLVGRPAYLPPRVRNVVLRDCGHMPMWDDPRQVARMLLTASS
jgi:pimeloyl-ACP methyl ester carboxylesterase